MKKIIQDLEVWWRLTVFVIGGVFLVITFLGGMYNLLELICTGIHAILMGLKAYVESPEALTPVFFEAIKQDFVNHENALNGFVYFLRAAFIFPCVKYLVKKAPSFAEVADTSIADGSFFYGILEGSVVMPFVILTHMIMNAEFEIGLQGSLYGVAFETLVGITLITLVADVIAEPFFKKRPELTEVEYKIYMLGKMSSIALLYLSSELMDLCEIRIGGLCVALSVMVMCLLIRRWYRKAKECNE